MNWHLLVVDIQEAFASHIAGWQEMLPRCETLIQAFQKLGLPITATEQNPRRLGSTVSPIKQLLAGVPIFAKMHFSCLRASEVGDRVRAATPVNLVLVGIETHVCVLQTALDALASPDGVTPYLPVDAIGSRRELDRATAFRRLERAGAILTTVESVIFEIVEEAGTDRFRAILPLVK